MTTTEPLSEREQQALEQMREAQEQGSTLETQIETLRAEHEQRGETLPVSVAHALRQSNSAPVVQKFKEWVDTLLPATPPNSALGKAPFCYRPTPP